MSDRKANPSHMKSQPVTPPGAMIKYIRVVQGMNITPRNGKMNVLKVRLYGALISHHRKLKNRGPRNTSAKKAQHIEDSSLLLICVADSCCRLELLTS